MALHDFKRRKIQVAGETPFDNTGTDLVSDNVQDAIEEINNKAVLREVTLVQLGGSLFMNIESNVLFEPEPVNDTIYLLGEKELL